eukprot:7070364-Pyramimonas_sp.AAC.1
MRHPTTASPSRASPEREGSRALGRGSTKLCQLARPRRAAALLLLVVLGAPSFRGRVPWQGAALGAARAVEAAAASQVGQAAGHAASGRAQRPGQPPRAP